MALHTLPRAVRAVPRSALGLSPPEDRVWVPPAACRLNCVPSMIESAAASEDRSTRPKPVYPRVIMAMMGSRDHCQPMKAVYEHGKLVRFITDFWLPPESAVLRWARALPVGNAAHLKARFDDELKHADVVALGGALQHL